MFSSIALDVFALDDRLSQIASFSASSSYAKKSSLQKDLELFLSSLPFLQPTPVRVSYVVFLFGKTGRGRLKYTIPLVLFLHGRGLLRVLALCALRMGQWTP